MKILVHFRHFPVAMGRWFDWALRDLGHEVFSVGPYDGPRIPWGEQYVYPDYDFPPDIETIDADHPLKDILERMPWKPDLILQAGDTVFLHGDSGDIPNVILATDPHVIDYKPRLKHATHFACMQNCHLNDYPNFENKFWVPYGYKEDLHKDYEKEPEYDVVFIGLQYPQRTQVLDRFKNAGLRVYSGMGKIYEDYVRIYNSGKIAFNYSSKDDLPARFWEGMAMGRCVLTNFIPDLSFLRGWGFEDGVTHATFSGEYDVVEKAIELLEGDKWVKIGKRARNTLEKGNHTYKDRVKLILKHVFEEA